MRLEHHLVGGYVRYISPYIIIIIIIIYLCLPGASVDSADKNGNTPLHLAAQNGHQELLVTLLMHGADPTR